MGNGAQQRVPVVKLGTSMRLVAMVREKDARDHAYIVSDRHGAALFVAQRLPAAAAYINALRCDDRVSAASLYEAASKPRLVHRRWSVVRCSLEELPDAFAAQRRAMPSVEPVVLVLPHRLKVVDAE